MLSRVLISHIKRNRREKLALALAGDGHFCLFASNAADTIERASESLPDVIFCDRSMPGLDGFDLVAQLARHVPGVPVILIGERSPDLLSCEVIERGANDFLVWPPDTHGLRLSLRNALALRRREQRLRLSEREIRRLSAEAPIVAASQTMIEVLEAIERAAGLDTPVILSGEMGSGRELLARAIHAQSSRRWQPCVVLPCELGREEDALAELFGCAATLQRPARAGLLAGVRNGTLVLHEATRLSTEAQQRLLQIIEEGQVQLPTDPKPRRIDTRLIITSSLDSTEAADARHFPIDLYSRFDDVHIHLPPLRDRREDIPLLADHFLAHFCRRLAKPLQRIDDEALETLLRYRWPGNLRELAAVIERAVLLATSDTLSVEDLPPEVVSHRSQTRSLDSGSLCLRQARRVFEARMIRRALRATGGNRTHAARLLSISQRALLYKIKEFGLRD